ncbi:hypothetical protein ABEF79_06105 [Acinetobacter sp. ANC 7454]|uniref:hypothetical protein n=1 Tax=Acinetobacter thermotolerans TaxID=3151487 RepID=UPI00325AE371
MGGKSGGSQVVGHRYFASVVKFIGFRIEKLLGVNFDKRKWIMNGNNSNALEINEPNLYGETEGGVAGVIDIHLGTQNQEPNKHYQEHDELASGYPYKSYLVFRGENGKGFYHGNTNYMKDCLLWPKRTRVQNDGSEQWYKIRNNDAVVCEIGREYESTKQQYRTTVLVGEKVDESRQVTIDGNALPIVEDQYTLFIDPITKKFLEHFEATGVTGAQTGVGTQRSILLRLTENDYIKGLSIAKITFVASGQVINREIVPPPITVYSSKSWVEDDRHVVEIICLINPLSTDIYQNAEGPENIRADIWSVLSSVKVELFLYEQTWITSTENPDINPIHKIREIIINPYPWGMGNDEFEINDENFKKAADRIYDEGLGISWAIKDKDCIEAIQELCHHIDAGVRKNRNTGKYEVVLFRDDWDSEDIYTIQESKIKSMRLEIQNADEIVNHLDVSFYDRDNIKQGSFSISENGLIKTTGQVNQQDLEFPYFQNMRNAELVAQWKLRNLSTPKWKGTFTTGFREARKFQKYGVIELPWSKKWQGTIKARILNISLGDGVDNTVTIEFEEIVPKSGAMTGTVIVDEQNVSILEPQPCRSEPFELPYYMLVWNFKQRTVDDELSANNEYGLVGAVAARPQPNSVYAIMMTHDGTPDEEWSRAATVNYSPYALIDQEVSKTTHQFIVKNASNLSGLKAGTLMKVGSDVIGTPSEWMSFEDQDPDTGVITVKRGLLDTEPQEWDVGTEIYFCGTDIAYDPTEYSDSDNVLVSVLTTTPSGILPLLGSETVEMQSRAIRPYPPANVKFNGNYWIETHVVSSDLVLTWSHRNRLQQTAATHIDWYDGSVTIEDGVTYSLELSTVDGVLLTETGISSDTFTIDADVFTPNKAHKLKFWSVRAGFDSYQIFEHNFFAESVSLILTAAATSSGISGNTVPTANINIDVDESLKANMQFDGSVIIGKAEPGATITIEVDD